MLQRIAIFSIFMCFVQIKALAHSEHAPELDFTLASTQVHEVHSDVTEQDYLLLVGLPDGYDPNSNKKYPVIYVLDAQWDFTLSHSIYGKLHYDGDLPEAIVVGITWGGKEPNIDALRSRDFRPTENNTDGAKLFLTAFEKEFIPYIATHYQTNEQRVITGTSFGGLFVAYAMLENPLLFDGYIALAASFWAFPNDLMEAQLNQLSKAKGDKKIWYYLGCGSNDGCADSSTEMFNHLTKKGIDGVQVQFNLVEGIGHAGITPIGMTLGLKFAFKRSFFSNIKKSLFG